MKKRVVNSLEEWECIWLCSDTEMARVKKRHLQTWPLFIYLALKWKTFWTKVEFFLVLPLNYRLGIYFNGSFICLLQDLLYLFRWCFFFLMILLFFELERTFCKTCDCLWMNVLLWTRVMSVMSCNILSYTMHVISVFSFPEGNSIENFTDYTTVPSFENSYIWRNSLLFIGEEGPWLKEFKFGSSSVANVTSLGLLQFHNIPSSSSLCVFLHYLLICRLLYFPDSKNKRSNVIVQNCQSSVPRHVSKSPKL